MLKNFLTTQKVKPKLNGIFIIQAKRNINCFYNYAFFFENPFESFKTPKKFFFLRYPFDQKFYVNFTVKK